MRGQSSSATRPPRRNVLVGDPVPVKLSVRKAEDGLVTGPGDPLLIALHIKSILKFIHEAERERDRMQRDRSHLLLRFPSAHSHHGWDRPKPVD